MGITVKMFFPFDSVMPILEIHPKNKSIEKNHALGCSLLYYL